MERINDQSWNSSYTYQVSKHSAEMLHNLNTQRKDGGRFCDVILRVGEESFPAHKAVLAACSLYFESVFSCQTECDSEAKELEMHTISPKVFKDILDFAYTSKIVVRLESFPELMTAAKFLLMRSVIEICQEVIKQSNVQILVPPSRGGDVSFFRTTGDSDLSLPLPVNLSNGNGVMTNGTAYQDNSQHTAGEDHGGETAMSDVESQCGMPVLQPVDRLPVSPVEMSGATFTEGSPSKRGRGRPKKVSECSNLNDYAANESDIFICGICGKSFTQLDQLRNHEAQHGLGPGPTTDSVSDRDSLGLGDGPTLIAQSYGGMMENGVQTESSVNNSHKRERTRRHVGCDICGKVFRDVYHLNRHKLSHSGEKPYACPVCGLRFKRKDRMSYHVRSHDGSVGKPYVCQSCGKGFSRPDHLNGHIKQVHTTERPHKCQICNASFATRDRLRSHHACHEDKIPCQVCGKYLRAAYMTDHLKKHSEGPHNFCSICNKDGQETAEKCPHQDSEGSDVSFSDITSGSQLKSPIKMDTGELDCNGSDAAIPSTPGTPSSSGVGSKVKEAGPVLASGAGSDKDTEKKHLCAECGQGFRTKSYLNKHLQRVHGLVGGIGKVGFDLTSASLTSPFSPQQNMSLLESFGFQIVQSAFASSLADTEGESSTIADLTTSK